MELNEYQKKALSTCMPSCNNFVYMLLNLQGELGEFSSKVAKAVRKEQAMIVDCSEEDVEKYNIANPDCQTDGNNHLYLSTEAYESLMPELKLELGDILWQLSGLCFVLGFDLSDVAQANLEKLAARKKAGTISGNGDGVNKEDGRKAD